MASIIIALLPWCSSIHASVLDGRALWTYGKL